MISHPDGWELPFRGIIDAYDFITAWNRQQEKERFELFGGRMTFSIRPIDVALAYVEAMARKHVASRTNYTFHPDLVYVLHGMFSWN